MVYLIILYYSFLNEVLNKNHVHDCVDFMKRGEKVLKEVS